MSTLPARLRSRDRRGRGVRGPLMPAALPRFVSRSEDFDRAVLAAYAPIQARFAAELDHLDIAIDTIPRMRLRTDLTILPDDIASDGPVPLGRVISAGVDRYGNPTRPRIVLFRKPIELRAPHPQERAELLDTVLVALVASFLNVAPTVIDPSFEL